MLQTMYFPGNFLRVHEGYIGYTWHILVPNVNIYILFTLDETHNSIETKQWRIVHLLDSVNCKKSTPTSISLIGVGERYASSGTLCLGVRLCTVPPPCGCLFFGVHLPKCGHVVFVGWMCLVHAKWWVFSGGNTFAAHLHSLKTNSLHLKIDAWKTFFVFSFEKAYFAIRFFGG